MSYEVNRPRDGAKMQISGSVSSRGKVTIPSAIREVLDIEDGDRANFIVTEDWEVKIEKYDGQ